MIPARFEPQVVGAIHSGLMSCVVSGIATLSAAGLVPGFARTWVAAWLTAWLVAFPVVLIMAPIARRAARRIVGKAAE